MKQLKVETIEFESWRACFAISSKRYRPFYVPALILSSPNFYIAQSVEEMLHVYFSFEILNFFALSTFFACNIAVFESTSTEKISLSRGKNGQVFMKLVLQVQKVRQRLQDLEVSMDTKEGSVRRLEFELKLMTGTLL